MSKKLPDFDQLKSFYLGKGYKPEQVKTMIGGDINSKDVTNTCIVRLSGPLNSLGHPIPAWTEQFRTRQGKDKRWYGLRVKDFWNYMLKTYGQPKITAKSPLSRSQFKGPQGIIGFRVNSFKDATGHFTLWDGNDLLYGGEDHDYWAISSEAALWQAGDTYMYVPEV
jgi:hypothetical protein